MSTELRGFRYAAEPLLARRRWELDGLVAQLGRLVARVAEVRRDVGVLRAQLEAGAEASARARGGAIDPAGQARALQWLALAHGRLATAQGALEALESERDALRERVRERQAGLEAIEADRAEALREFGMSESGRAATEADRDWSARAAARPSLPTDLQESDA